MASEAAVPGAVAVGAAVSGAVAVDTASSESISLSISSRLAVRFNGGGILERAGTSMLDFSAAAG